jgi:tetratricopeptide (TPR) repeat protein
MRPERPPEGEVARPVERAESVERTIPESLESTELPLTRDAVSREEVTSHVTAARLHEQASKWEQAAAEWNAVLELDPGNREARRRLAAIEQRLAAPSTPGSRTTQPAPARRADPEPTSRPARQERQPAPSPRPEPEREEPPSVSPAQIKALYTQGVRAFNNEDYGTAINYFRQVLQADPDHAAAKDYLARAEARRRRLGAGN